MRTVSFVFISLLSIAGVDFARATTACGTPPEDVAGGPRYPGLPAAGTRDWDAALAIDIRCKKGSSATCAEADGVGPPDCVQGVFWHSWQPKAGQRRHLDRKSHIPQDGKLTKLPNRVGGARYTCDHVVELNMLKQVMEAPGGVCDQAHAKYTASTNANEKKKILATLVAVRAVTFNKRNLHFFDRAVESQKTLSVQNPAHLGTLDYYRMSELHDFINGAGPGSRMRNVAQDMDRIIERTYTRGPYTVTAIWTAYQTAVKAAYTVAVAKAKKVVARDQQCNANANSQHSGTTRLLSRSNLATASRMLRRHLLSELAFSGGIDSSLIRRAGGRRSASRSGPNAPKGPCCPKKNEVPKKVVNKSATKTRPKPARKPRQPAKRPAARAPTGRKQRIARPATRGRREVGKPNKPRRTTPKRKPKVIPKPTRRPKGKPRTRRRRR